MNRAIAVGDTLLGPCAGIFGSAAEQPRVVEAIGPDWAVVRRHAHGQDYIELARGEINLTALRRHRAPGVDR
ncbi:hypothetical protein [Streptacidiphilus albus]|uniref:hypothetical protein n=1 Tax=Streptacidiphilus albus TaxID=105425 RepID=UPI00054BBF9A|nr:hypothetical protein [Streptacidiphilus albus]